MKNKNFSNIIVFLLFALMLFKVSSFHACTHEDANTDNIENCKICELATENENNDFIVVTPPVVKSPIFISTTHEPTASYNLVLSSSFLHSSFFGRPPPQAA